MSEKRYSGLERERPEGLKGARIEGQNPNTPLRLPGHTADSGSGRQVSHWGTGTLLAAALFLTAMSLLIAILFAA